MKYTESPPIHRRKTHRKIPSSSSSSTEEPPDDHSSTIPSLSVTENDIENDDNESLNETVSESNFANSQYTSNSVQLANTTSSYINVAPLPIFNGFPTDCPVSHLARFDRVCHANNANSIETIIRIFPVTLDGDAALWYDLTIEPNKNSMTWREIRSEFLKTFTPPDFANRARTELMSIRMKDCESINSYHLRLQWILKKWPEHGFPDTLLKGIFVDGLRDDYQDWILPRRPETLDEAVRLAVSWEQARSVREARRGNDGGGCEVKCGFCEGEHEEKGCEVKRRMKELWMSKKDGAMVVTTNRELSPSMSFLKRGGQSCQCWKHQCWKRIDRSNSVIADENNANSHTTNVNES